jgi:hypothetical protein
MKAPEMVGQLSRAAIVPNIVARPCPAANRVRETFAETYSIAKKLGGKCAISSEFSRHQRKCLNEDSQKSGSKRDFQRCAVYLPGEPFQQTRLAKNLGQEDRQTIVLNYPLFRPRFSCRPVFEFLQK